MNWEQGTARLFSYRTTSQVISFPLVSRTSASSISNQISQPMSSPWTRVLSSASRLITVQSMWSMQSAATMQTSHLPRSMTLTNSKLCVLLTLHGVRWTQQPSEIAGIRPVSCPISILPTLHQPHLPSLSCHSFTPLSLIRILSRKPRTGSGMLLMTWNRLACCKARTGWTLRPTQRIMDNGCNDR